MSHSKRNTSRAVFTSYERELARKSWTATSARLSRESFLPFSACRLCLETAIDPVSCAHGDIFCRECALGNILAQKKEIRRLEKLREQEEREARERQAELDTEAHERAVREFELTQNGLDVPSRSASSKTTAATTTTPTPTPTPASGTRDRQGSTSVVEGDGQNGAKKRKFEIDEDEVKRIAAADRAKARKAIDDEKAARPTLPSFWVPTLTPTSNTRDTLHEVVKKTKTSPICPASPDDKPHAYSLHALVSVHFTEDDDDDDRQGKGKGKGKGGAKARICPSCKKGLGNASKAVLAKPCGHVLCGSCVDKFMRPHGHDPHAAQPDALRCYVCDADLADRAGHHKGKKKDKDRIRPGLVELRSEGTGYSAGGTNQVRKDGVAAFQC
ncbi:hypothetical protein F4802DRAFT_610761 [Xylaria palmicola]|nr:hypothetical protein F4802DRAFT_610761 [Xylaria palmicola]